MFVAGLDSTVSCQAGPHVQQYNVYWFSTEHPPIYNTLKAKHIVRSVLKRETCLVGGEICLLNFWKVLDS